MVAQHFSARKISTASAPHGYCQVCAAWTQTVEQHMARVREQAKQHFAAFLQYSPQSIVCLDDAVVETVDRFGVSWKSFAEALREGDILEWYDRELMVPLLERASSATRAARSARASYQITARSGRQARALRPKSVPDFAASSEYYAAPGRYRMVLRCTLPGVPYTPLVVETTYNTPAEEGKSWVLLIGEVLRPAAEKWNEDYTRIVCQCGEDERTTSYEQFDQVFPLRAW